MEIKKNKNGSQLNVAIIGRLDTVTAPELEAEVNADLADVNDLVLDFSDLQYISSAGLRVILSLQKTMNKSGKMTIKNVNDTVMDVFEITGFADILNIAN